jgi:hypothetical protein
MIFITQFFKIKHKLHVSAGSGPLPQLKILGAHLRPGNEVIKWDPSLEQLRT